MTERTHRPRARRDGILTETLDDELLVCDTDDDAAHVLNATAATVWRACDGSRDLAALQAHCELDETVLRSSDLHKT